MNSTVGRSTIRRCVIVFNSPQLLSPALANGGSGQGQDVLVTVDPGDFKRHGADPSTAIVADKRKSIGTANGPRRPAAGVRQHVSADDIRAGVRLVPAQVTNTLAIKC